MPISTHPAILESIADVVIVIDAKGIIIACNPASVEMLGWEPEELCGQNVSVLAGGEHGTRHDAYMHLYRETGQQRMLRRPRRLDARHKDGSQLPITLAVTETVIHGQQVFTGVIRDASAEAARERDSERVHAELRVQMRINQVLQSACTAPELVDGVLHELISLDQLDVQKKAGFFLIEEPPADPRRLPMVSHGPTTLRLAHTVGEFSKEFLEKEATVALGSCLCGRAAVSGEVIISHDCFEDARHERSFHGMTAHGHYIVPVKADDRVIGVLFLYTDPNPIWDERRRTLLETLGTQIGMGLARAWAEEELRVQRAELHRLAHFDDLTGILNRRAIFERLSAERSRSARQGEPVSVILFDIDHFKTINDQHGHVGGDTVLREVARRAKSALRPYDEVGRYGGEEFLVVLPGCTVDTAAIVAERLRQSFARDPMCAGSSEVVVTASFGVACCAANQTEELLVARADEALYRAKRTGRNRVDVAEASSLDHQASARH